MVKKKKTVKYPLLPMRIRQRVNGSFYDTYTGRTIPTSELQRYSGTEPKTEVKEINNKVVKPQWWQNYENY